MHELWLTSELFVGGCLFIVLFVLGAVFVRRRLIARGSPLTVCALREASGRWRFGLLRYGTNHLEWFSLVGVSLRPARRWERTLLEFGAGRPLETGERPEVMISGAISVGCTYRDARLEIALAQASYTALRSWLEASPPGRNVNVA